MRNRHFVVLAGLSLFSWAAITSYLFLQRPQGKVTPSLHSDLDQLNSELQNQYQLNDQLLKRLLTLHNALGSQSGIVEVVSPEVDDNKAPAPTGPIIAVLLFACNRVTVTRSLDLLIKYRPTKENFPIIVSQDCGHPQTAEAIKGYGEQIRHIQQPDQSDVSVLPKEKKFKGYYKIARHYGWALNQTFYHFNYDTVIIVEDDLDIAPDFFEYFLATYSLLRSDPTLWCVSAWNDNGKDGMIQEDPELLHRTDFFPGLGWMLTKELWGELQWHWPKSYWDDWMRQPEQRKERACIRPEISRTRTFGKIGVSNGLFYEKHLKYIKLNEKPVPFTTMDLSYLKKDNYDQRFVKAVYDCSVVSWEQLKADKITQPGEVRVTYTSKETYKKITKAFGLMDDLKSGVPRTGYRGVVSFVFKGRKVYLAPPADWKGYDTTWS